MPLQALYTSADLRRVEDAARARMPAGSAPLMARAGLAAAEQVRRLMPERGRRVLLLAGPGNNGGDAFEAAVHLKEWFYGVEVAFAGDPGRLPADAAAALSRWRRAGGECLERLPEPRSLASRCDLLVDGLFGIGLARPLEGIFTQWIATINRAGLPVLALDVPSGIHADRGAVMGCAVRATHTLTFIARKPGLYTLDGPDHCGEVALAGLDVDAPALVTPSGWLLDADCLRTSLAPRPRNFHKGKAGNVAILGGARTMVGAALLAGRAALACGAGRVYLGLLDAHAPSHDALQPELMLRGAGELPLEQAVIAAGPGMGQDSAARAALQRALASPAALVLDADALNLIAADPALAQQAGHRAGAVLMTPHPAEAARLLGVDTHAVQSDRLSATRAIAERFGACVALKGNGTVVADLDGRWWINPTGHPGMASAGMGDALTGIAAALLAQGLAARQALCAAVWLHGAAGDALARRRGPIGTLASDVIAAARGMLNDTLQPARRRGR
ncbi:MAG: NAD(P)H-hydrate dehydratase [Burkholderiales bacterium]|nr:NAD(P)H-hydrate dehydratase [Burkholderiales bacterium]